MATQRITRVRLASPDGGGSLCRRGEIRVAYAL